MLAYVAAVMVAMLAKGGRLDRIAMGLSGLCLVHCIATAVLLGLLATSASFLANPVIHETGLALASAFALLALGRGVLARRRLLPLPIGIAGLGLMAAALVLPEGGDVLLTMAGVALVALAHWLNCRPASANE